MGRYTCVSSFAYQWNVALAFQPHICITSWTDYWGPDTTPSEARNTTFHNRTKTKCASQITIASIVSNRNKEPSFRKELFTKAPYSAWTSHRIPGSRTIINTGK